MTDEGRNEDLKSFIPLWMLGKSCGYTIRRIPRSFRSHPRLAEIDLYYSFWTLDWYSNSASTFTLEPVPLEFQG